MSYYKARQRELMGIVKNIENISGKALRNAIDAIDADEKLKKEAQAKVNPLQLQIYEEELQCLEEQLSFIQSDIDNMQSQGIEQKKYILLIKNRLALRKQILAVQMDIETFKIYNEV